MAVGNTGVLTEQDIRVWLRDRDPGANRLLDDYEFKPEEIRAAMTLAVDIWNDTPPYLPNLDINTFPFRYGLLMGTVSQLLQMVGNSRRRNFAEYQIPGGAINDQHPDRYLAAAELWQQRYMQWIASNKRAFNIRRGFGMV